MTMVIHILVALFGLFQGISSSADVMEFSGQNATSAKVLHRQKRIVYTYNSCAGVLVALSVPLIIPHRNIFVSYNFEMNYNMPQNSTDYTQGVLKRIDSPELHTKRDTGRQISANFTRKKIYRTIEVNLNRLGLNGKRCLFRAICETAEYPLHEHNGIVGDLIHILLTPSQSKDEKLPTEFYRAEKLGANHDCGKYRKQCSQSLLNVISVLI